MYLCNICRKLAILVILFSFMNWQFSCAAQQTASQNINAAAAGISNAADTQPPSIPGSLTVTYKTHTSISLSWAKSSDNVEVRGYQIYRDGKKILTTSKTSYTNMNLVPGQQYTYAIRAYDARGNISESSEPLSVKTLSDSHAPTVPGSPTISSATYTSVTLSWSPSWDNIGVKGYEVYIDGMKKVSTKNTSCICKSLSPGKSYQFTIKAFDAAGNYSSGSIINGSTAADTSAPSVPNGLKAEGISETEATLVWSSSFDNVKVKNYEIYSEGKKVGSTSKTSWACKKLIPGKSVTYSVRAVDTSGLQSAESKPLTITALKDRQNPTAPGSLKIESKKGSSLSLSWNASTDNTKVESYHVYCNGSVIATTTRTTRSVKIPSGLNIGIYWVRACDLSGNLSEKSNTVTVVTAK